MEVITSIRQLEAVRDEWNAIADLRGEALLRHEWLISAARTLHDGDELAVVCIRRAGQLVAVAPLTAPRRYGVAPLQFVGAAALHEPGGLPARDGAARGALIDALIGLQRPLALQRISPQYDEVHEFRRLAQRQGWVLLKQTAPTLSLPLQHGTGPLVENASAKLRYDLKRARTRARAHGEVTMDVLAPTPTEVDDALATFEQVEASSWKAREGSALLARPKLQAFFRTYSRLAAQAGIFRVFFLRVGSRIAAAQIAVEVYGRLWVLKIGYDESMARSSPGFLLTAEAIRYAAVRGLRSYEFLGSPEAWQRRWQPDERPAMLLAFYPLTVHGCIGASLHIAGSTWRTVRRGLRRAG